ncbi:MAG: hypothetical protein EPO25_17115 [Gammaproteobacteria bacterium]|nr:MAG: hypothetical protein EPO25_17115 [Gammaproteobacteria bacterium]
MPIWRIVAMGALAGQWLCAGATLANAGSKAGSEGARVYEQHCAGCHGADGQSKFAPLREALGFYEPAAIQRSLESGTMAVFGAALSATEKAAVAAFLGSQEPGAGRQAGVEPKCRGEEMRFDFDHSIQAGGWGFDTGNTRFLPAGQARLANDEIPRLQLAWSRVFPGSINMRSQPAIAGGALFIGSQPGTVYALDARTGCVRWTFQADAEVRSSINIGRITPANGKERLAAFFVDVQLNVYALDAASGELIWRETAAPDPFAHSTGSPVLSRGRLYVPISGHEVVAKPRGDMSCCTTRGAVAAYDAASGKLLWRTSTIAAEARVQRRTKAGEELWGPSGAMVWSPPTIDHRRNLLYVGTGTNHSSPATDTSDAIIAMDLDSGAIRWVRQVLRGDAWNAACWLGPAENCPLENGPDLDFGAPPILAQLQDGRDIIIAGQKSGNVYALDPDEDGRILWQAGVGRGGAAGGIHWGMAVDATRERVYVAISDRDHPVRYGPGRPGLYALELRTGESVWRAPAQDVCDGRPGCDPGFSAPVTALSGAVFAGSLDGHLRAYAADNGAVVWDFDTAREFSGLNGASGRGGSIDAVGPVVAAGMVYVNSGYALFRQMPGNVLLAFSPASP